jgi:acetyl-CoA carboxylase biotin carboxyl carrier protein
MAEPDHDGALTDRLAQQARALVERLEGTTVQRLTIQAGDARIEIERSVGVVAPAAAPAPAADGGAAPGAAEQDGRNAVLAPLVGRFYRASQPGAAPFVEVGDVVDQGQTVCIVEAMKMMNEVAPAAPGRVAEILVENGEFVEFEQVLMYLEPVEGEG